MTKYEIRDKLFEYFINNQDAFIEVIEALDDWCGYLDFRRWYYIDDFNELFYDYQPLFIASRVAFGDFNPMHEYFSFDGNGNLISGYKKRYDDFLDIYFLDKLAEEYGNLHLEGYETLDSLICKYKRIFEDENT